MGVKRIAVAVINDLVTDQRVRKTCNTMLTSGWEPVLFGRQLKGSLQIPRSYKVVRMRLPFTKGAKFYAIYNVTLFFRLLFLKTDAIWANDLDTLLACTLAARIKKKPLVYDSHEFFTEVPEIEHKPFVKKVWSAIEKWALPKTSGRITVNNSIAQLLEERYGFSFQVVRNIPEGQGQREQREQREQCLSKVEMRDKSGVTLNSNDLWLVLQGSGINVDRGAKELLEAVVQLKDVSLMIIGDGDVVPQLKRFVTKEGLSKRVLFLGKMPYDNMMNYTRLADVGVTLDKSTNVNYQYSLPNKLFDYIKAGVPVLASPLVEVQNIVESYNIGWVLLEHSVETIVKQVQELVDNRALVKEKADKTHLAINELNWENEATVITKILQDLND